MSQPPKVGGPPSPGPRRNATTAAGKARKSNPVTGSSVHSTFAEVRQQEVVATEPHVPLTQQSDQEMFGLFAAEAAEVPKEALKAMLDTASGMLGQVKDSAFKAAGLNVLSALQQVLSGMLPGGSWLKLPFDQVWALARRRKQKKKDQEGQEDGDKEAEGDGVEEELVRLFDEAGKPCFEEPSQP